MNNLYFVGFTVEDIGACKVNKRAAIVDAFSSKDAQHQLELRLEAARTNPYLNAFSVYEVRPFRLDDLTSRGFNSFQAGLVAQGDPLTGVLFLPEVKA